MGNIKLLSTACIIAEAAQFGRTEEKDVQSRVKLPYHYFSFRNTFLQLSKSNPHLYYIMHNAEE